MLEASRSVSMNDLLYVLLFFGCVAASVGLAKLCDKLWPRENRSKP
jgi:hypothetical protein